jgi:hypothetical protein
MAPSALVWWGQLAMEEANGPNSNSLSPAGSLNATTPTELKLNQVPTSLLDPVTGVLKDDNFNLGRFAMLLVPASSGTTNVAPNGTSVASYVGTAGSPPMAAIDYSVAPVSSGGTNYDITQSRVDVAQCTTSQIMSIVRQAVGGARSATTASYEADHFCYRHAALRSPYDDGSGLVNGYFRMTPIALQGVSSFAIEWTDGSVYAAGNTDPVTGGTVSAALVGTTRWYGLGNAYSGNNSAGAVDPSGATGSDATGDSYDAVFSFDNPTRWPVALRFRYHIADPTGQLVGGRDFVEVVKLPK